LLALHAADIQQDDVDVEETLLPPPNEDMPALELATLAEALLDEDDNPPIPAFDGELWDEDLDEVQGDDPVHMIVDVGDNGVCRSLVLGYL
jgi:hypothetical protein